MPIRHADRNVGEQENAEGLGFRPDLIKRWMLAKEIVLLMPIAEPSRESFDISHQYSVRNGKALARPSL